MTQTIRTQIRTYVEERFFVAFGADGLDEGDDLFEAGVFDSMSLVEFIAFIEERFSVVVDAEAVMEGSVASVAGAAAYVAARAPAGAADAG